jgi:hypothetical protein
VRMQVIHSGGAVAGVWAKDKASIDIQDCTLNYACVDPNKKFRDDFNSTEVDDKVCTCVCVCVCMHACMYVCVSECVSQRVYVCMYACIYIYVFSFVSEEF